MGHSWKTADMLRIKKAVKKNKEEETALPSVKKNWNGLLQSSRELNLTTATITVIKETGLTRQRKHLHSCRVGDFGLKDVDFVILVDGFPTDI